MVECARYIRALNDLAAFRWVFDPSPTLRQAQGAAQGAGSMMCNNVNYRVLSDICSRSSHGGCGPCAGGGKNIENPESENAYRRKLCPNTRNGRQTDRNQ